MNCPGCGALCASSSRYCAECGARLDGSVGSAATTHSSENGCTDIAPRHADIFAFPSYDTSDPSNIAAYRRLILGEMARSTARNLPDEINFVLLLSYVAFERGDGVPLESVEFYNAALHEQLVELKFRTESRLRELRLGPDDLDKTTIRNLCFLLEQNPRMMLYEVAALYLSSISRESLDVAPVEVLKAAESTIRANLVRWLRNYSIPFSIKPTIRIPSTSLPSLLQPYKGGDFFVHPEIPNDKLANARQAARVPEDETVVALVDCTFFGSAKDCVLFGTKAIYFKNSTFDQFLPYSEFPDIVFSPQGETVLCHGQSDAIVINLSGSKFAAGRLLEVLDKVKSEAIKREPSGEVRDARGLTTLPGMSELKRMLQEEVVEPLRDPERFKRYKIDIPNGILMYGPPGCGKTFVAQRLASELNYNFYEVSPSAVGSSYIHGSTLKINELFEEAAKNAPALMFVDEFEGMVPARRSLGGEQQFKSEEVNEWLVQIGSCAQRRILFVAATNEPWGIDDAVQRSGRLDKKVYVGPPDCEALGDMLLHHLDGRPFTSAQDIRLFAETIANQGYSASDIKLLADEAAKLAMKANQDISSVHLTAAAAERVPPSISREQQELYLAFKEQRKVGA